MSRLRDLREDHDLTIRDVAKILHCDFSLYSKYEREERPIPLEILIALSKFYNTNLEYLLSLTNYKGSLLHIRKKGNRK